ncbi:S8 family serine peptidase [Antribacter soli]|uniref:S8 family serine peptidase n=1 Tax=Antribacter soli TaxID=2910976 RepID=UPI0024B49149|nr:S8 family serine peptidase [Antribacter soli]
MPHVPRRSGLAAAFTVPVALAGSALAPLGAAAGTGEPVVVIIELDGPGAAGRVGLERLAEARVAGPGEVGALDALVATYAAAADDVAAEQDAALDALQASGIPVEERSRITGLINAVVGEVPADRVDELAAAEGVAHVTADRPVRALTDGSVPSTGGPAVRDGTDASGSLRGTGVTVAVIDTGVDYTLADLGGGFGEGHRVVDGYDFVADDADPMDEHHHGTHVAGIIAGSGAESVTGVAPDVTLTAYRVLDENGEGYLSDVLLGFQAAADPAGDHPADVVNMSLGSDGGADDPLARAAAAAVEAGTVVVAAAGNAGPGAQTVGTPAAAPGVLAVGASTTGIVTPTIAFEGASVPAGSVRRYSLSANPPPDPVTARLVDVGAGTPEDYDRAGDVTGAVVVYQGYTSGPVSGYDLYLAELAEARGAVGAIVYQPTAADPVSPAGVVASDPQGFEASADGTRDLTAQGWDTRRESLVMFTMYSGDYLGIRAQVLAGTVRASIGGTDATDLVASFSSRGPSGVDVKPEIVAPGVEIRSTIPAWQGIEGNAYRLSGTSMAAPHVAGAAALVRQAHPDESALDIRARIIGGSRPLDSSDAGVSPFVQGAGALAVDRAIGQDVTASPDVIGLGLADTVGTTRSRTATVTLTNHGPTSRRLGLDVVESGVSDGRVQLSARSVTLEPGGRADVEITVTAGDRAAAGEVSGVLVATDQGGSTLRVPYALLVRPLVVRATPDVTEGPTRVVVQAAAPLQDPVLTVVAPSGRRSTVGLEPMAGRASWYIANLDVREGGVHSLEAAGSAGDRLLGGTGSLVGLGPERPGGWEQVGPVFTGGRTVTSPGAAGTALHVLQDSVNPFVTTDGGTTWTRITAMPVARGWALAAADPTVPGGFWLAVNGRAGRDVLDATYQGQLLRTPDAGETWDVLPLPDEAIEALVADERTVAVATASGVRFSRDRGQSWDLVPTAWAGPVANLALSGDHVFVQGLHGVWRAALAGGNVEQVLAPDELGNVTDLASDGGTVVVTGGSLAGAAVWRSSDAGATWERSDVLADAFQLDVTIVDGTTYLAYFDRVYTSADHGRTVSGPISVPPGSREVFDVDRWPGADGGLVLTTTTGVFESAAGGWRRYPIAGGATWTVDVGVDAAGADVLRTADIEGLKERTLTGLGTGGALDWGITGAEGSIGLTALDTEQSPLGARDVWWTRQDAFYSNGLHRRSLDGTDRAVGPTWLSLRDVAVSPLRQDTVAVVYAASPEAGILVSTDGFATWTSHPYDLGVREIRFDPARPERLWIAADEGLYRSDDLGRTITRVTRAPARTVHVDPEDPRLVVVGTDGGLLVSTDGGRRFRDSGIPNLRSTISAAVSVHLTGDLRQRAHADRVLVAGTNDVVADGVLASAAGVFVSFDDGRSWKPASNGLTALGVFSLDVSPDGTHVFAGTRNGGVFRTAVGDLLPRR